MTYSDISISPSHHPIPPPPSFDLSMQLSRDLVLSGLQSLLEPPSPEFIVQVGACHIRRGMPQGMDLLVLDDSPEEKLVKANVTFNFLHVAFLS